MAPPLPAALQGFAGQDFVTRLRGHKRLKIPESWSLAMTAKEHSYSGALAMCLTKKHLLIFTFLIFH